MPSGFSKSDLDSLFDTDGVGVAGRIFTADDDGNVAMSEDDPPVPVFLRELDVIFSEDTQDVPMYGETDVVASNPSFVCKSTDLADVDPGMTFTMPDLESHEDGYGKTYKITPKVIADGGPQAARVYLKEV
jgi:hypothetical protein